MGPSYEAITLYERARRHSWWRRIAARLRGRPTHLLDLATIVAGRPIRAHHYLGAQSVPIGCAGDGVGHSASAAVGAGRCRGMARDVGNMERHRRMGQGHLVRSAAGLESCPLESVYATSPSVFRTEKMISIFSTSGAGEKS